MTTHDNAFSKARHNIQPDSDAKNAKAAHEKVREILHDDPKLTDLQIDTVLIGSYGRDVSIKRVKDVDVLLRLRSADDSIEPDEALNNVASALEDHFDDPEIQDHSVKVEFEDFDLAVDAVPARPCSIHPGAGHWEIPDPDDGWIETHPERLGDLTSGLNKKFIIGDGDKGAYVPTVKLVRQVRRALDIEKPSGLYFEILCYWAFLSGNIDTSSQASYLASCLTEMVTQIDEAIANGLADPALDDAEVATSATPDELSRARSLLVDASRRAGNALKDTDFCRSALEWRELLGKDSLGDWVFPMPEACNEDGTAKHVSKPGERRAPRGTDRFA